MLKLSFVRNYRFDFSQQLLPVQFKNCRGVNRRRTLLLLFASESWWSDKSESATFIVLSCSMFKLRFPKNKRFQSSQICNQMFADCYELFGGTNLDFRF